MINNTKKNILKVFISNIAIILSGIIVGFLVPKFLGPTNYGYYKTYSLYLSYIGLFAIGFIDGIYLKYGGIEFEKLNKKEFRTYAYFLFILECAFSLIIVILSFCFYNTMYFSVLLFLAFSIIGKIFTGYYQLLSQMVSRFNELSFRNIISSILSIIVVIFLFFIYKTNGNSNINGKIYIILQLICQYILTIWYVHTYRNITFGDKFKLKEYKQDIKDLIKIGFPLLVSNLIGNFVLLIDRQFVSLLFDTKTYGIYSFSYNIMHLITVAISAMSTVLYPTLKKKKNKMDSYEKVSSSICIIVSALLSCYFIGCIIIKNILPEYNMSINILRIIFPILLFQALITIVMHNYYKATGRVLEILKQSIFMLIISIAFNFVFYNIFGTVESISIASLVCSIIWYIISEIRLFNNKFKNFSTFLYIVLISISFYFSTSFNFIHGLFIYLFLFAILTLIYYLLKIVKRK